TRITLAEKTEIHRKSIGDLQHPMHEPRSRRAGRGEGARSGPGAAADHCRYAGHQGFFDLLRADEVDMRIDTAGGNNRALSGDNLGASADFDGDARLDIAVTCLADGGNFSALDADICLDDAPVIDNQRIGDNGIGDRAESSCPCPMPSRMTLPPPNLTSSP